MENQFGTVQLEARGKCRAALGRNILEAQDLATTVAVEMSVAVRTIVADLEAPGAFAAGNALCDALFHQPVERAIERDAVVHDASGCQGCADFVVRQGMLAGLQGFDDRNARARDAAAVGRDEFAGAGEGVAVRRVIRHGSLVVGRLLMQHCSI